jgi:hypothetical protein
MVSRFGIYMVNLFHGLCQLPQSFATFQVQFDSPKTGHSAEQTADRIPIWLTFETKQIANMNDYPASASLPDCGVTQSTG